LPKLKKSNQNWEPKHVETTDKAQPVIEANTKIKKSKRPKLMEEVKSFKGFEETKQDQEKKAQEKIQLKEKVMDDIKTTKVELTHVDTVDKAQPVIESVPVRKNVHGQVMEEIQKAESKDLKHVDTVDKAKPVIDESAHVKQSVRPKMLEEVRSLSQRVLLYQESIQGNQKIPEQFKAKEAGDVPQAAGISAQKKKMYEESLDVAQKPIEGSTGKEGSDLDAVGSGATQRVKELYQKEVEEKNKSREGTVMEKEGDKVVKNLPPKKDLVDLI